MRNLSLETYFSWAYLGYKDIVMRYRRTVLGPFWLVLATAISISGLAFVSSQLFNSSLADSLVYVSSGLITWLFLSALVIEAASLFIQNATVLKHLKINYSYVITRVFTRSLIVYLHNLAFYFVVYLFYVQSFSLYILLTPLWVVVYFINFVALTCSLGFLGTRFRDVPQLVASVLSVCVFLTPIMWKKEALGAKADYISLNIFVPFLDVMRNALMGMAPQINDVKLVAAITLVNIFIAVMVVRKYQKRVIFWL